jgi:hypothetical protein
MPRGGACPPSEGPRKTQERITPLVTLYPEQKRIGRPCLRRPSEGLSQTGWPARRSPASVTAALMPPLRLGQMAWVRSG